MRPSAFRVAPGVAPSGFVAKGPNADSGAVNEAGRTTDGRAWVVRTFGNQSAAALAYMCFAISSDGKMVKDWWKFNVSTDEAMVMQARVPSNSLKWLYKSLRAKVPLHSSNGLYRAVLTRVDVSISLSLDSQSILYHL